MKQPPGEQPKHKDKNVIQTVLSAMKEKQSKLLRWKATRLGRKEQRDAILYQGSGKPQREDGT